MTHRKIGLLLVLGCLALAGCNTVRGFGKDLGAAGEALETVD